MPSSMLSASSTASAGEALPEGIKDLREDVFTAYQTIGTNALIKLLSLLIH